MKTGSTKPAAAVRAATVTREQAAAVLQAAVFATAGAILLVLLSAARL